MKKTFNKFMSLALAFVILVCCMGVLTSCKDNGPVIDNEETRLVLSTSELDGVFNPFYSSSGPDGSVVGMTQIGMLSADKEGKVSFGADEACVVLDYETEYLKDKNGETQQTVYRFVLKNDLKFSNGSPLTIKDVLFNLYVYLDPAYYGSSTIYSTEIIGLKEYRTQSTSESIQDSFNETFDAAATDRILRLAETIEEIYDMTEKDGSLTEAQLVEKLTELMEEYSAADAGYATLVADYELAKQYFRDELKTDYNYSKGPTICSLPTSLR